VEAGYPSSNIIRVIELKWVRWAVHAAQIIKVRTAQNRSQNAERKNAFGGSVLDDRILLRWEAYVQEIRR
jgi:hypothetical protein